MSTINYFDSSKVDQYSFIRIPKIMVRNPLFKPLSTDAKILYGVLLDRMSLVQKNNWLDEKGRAYVIYAQDDIHADLHFSKAKADGCLRELEDIGLEECVTQGYGLPNRLYVKKYSPVN